MKFVASDRLCSPCHIFDYGPDPTSSTMADPGVNTGASAHSVAITSSMTGSGNLLSSSTVYGTTIITVISCAATVGNCPASSMGMSLVASPVAIVVYSTQWITISTYAPVITDCTYNSFATSMVPIITINLPNTTNSPHPARNTVVFTIGNDGCTATDCDPLR